MKGDVGQVNFVNMGTIGFDVVQKSKAAGTGARGSG